MNQYHKKEIRPGRWHVIAPDGVPLYDDEPHGKDKPRVFTDEDKADMCVSQCNEDLEQNEFVVMKSLP